MMSNKMIRAVTALFILLFSGFQLQAQEKIEKRVQVTQAYQPDIKDAYKISELPDITDTSHVTPDFNYYLLPRRLETDVEVEPIPAATMVGEPLTELYSSYLKLGMGHKIAPLVEFSLTNKRSKDYALGLQLQHHSSTGKVTLDNDERAPAGYARNRARLFGKKFYDNAVLNGNVGVRSITRYFYGYDTRVDTSLYDDKQAIKQNIFRFEAGAGLNSTYIDSAHLNYNLELDYQYLSDRFESSENRLKFSGNLDKYHDQYHFGIHSEITYLDREFTMDTTSNTLVSLKPWVARFGDNWRVRGGVNFYADVVNGNTNARFFPVANVEYDIISQYIIPYGGIDGKIDLNSYDRVTDENPFVLPGLHVKNTNYKLIFFGGLKGHLSASVYYNTRLKYSFFDDMYFFINDLAATGGIANQFNVEYYDGERMNIFGELGIDLSDQLRLNLEGNYYKFVLYDDQARAWHKPAYDMTLSARYNLRDKIIAQADVFVSGDRWAKSGRRFGEETKLEGFVDMNMKLEYRYSKVLSGYVKLQNMLSNNYSIWNNYPVYGLHAYGGITYSF